MSSSPAHNSGKGPEEMRVLGEEGGVPVLRSYLSHVCTRLYICVHMGKHMDMRAKIYTHTQAICRLLCVETFA